MAYYGICTNVCKWLVPTAVGTFTFVVYVDLQLFLDRYRYKVCTAIFIFHRNIYVIYTFNSYISNLPRSNDKSCATDLQTKANRKTKYVVSS